MNIVYEEKLISSKQLIAIVNDQRATTGFVTDNCFVFGKQLVGTK